MIYIERAAQEAAALAFRLDSAGFRSAAIAFAPDDQGQTAAAVFAQVWAMLGHTVTTAQTIQSGLAEYSAPVAGMAAAGGEVSVLFGEVGASSETVFLQTLQDLGFLLPVAVTSAWFGGNFSAFLADQGDISGISISGNSASVMTTVAATVQVQATALGSLPFSGLFIDLGGLTTDRFGTAGPDALFGRDGADRLWGGGWADFLDGGAGSDVLVGQGGADGLVGGTGNDKLYGGKAGDALAGGLGDDTLHGGGGADQFVFADGDGLDSVRDFISAQGDSILLDADIWGGGLTAEQVVASFGRVKSWGMALVFGDGDALYVAGATDTATLAGDLIIL